jgi:hypothetical protein
MTYVELKAAIQQYLMIEYIGDGAEPTFVANIDNFIKNAEIIINNSVQLPAFRKNVTGTLTAGFQYIDLPADFLSVFSVAVVPNTIVDLVPTATYQYLLNKDVNYIREAFPYPVSQGIPKYYSLFDNTALIVGPTPSSSYNVELHYYAYPQSIVNAPSGTTWISLEFPNALLWGALVEGYIFLKGEAELIQVYQSKFDQVITELKQLGDGKNRQDSYRTTQVRDKVN